MLQVPTEISEIQVWCSLAWGLAVAS